MKKATNHQSLRAFTLTELLIAIAVLVVVILAASRIFGTVSQVTGIGQATSDVMTEAAAIERNLRSDLEKLSYEGVFAIRCVAVRNDINGAVLLDPDLPADEWLRCDQLVFFADGVQGSQSARISESSYNKGQATESFVYYGHAYQLPGARPFDLMGDGIGKAYDVAPLTRVNPWTTGAVPMVATTIGTNETTGDTDGLGNFMPSAAGNFPIAQPGAKQWLLARNSAILCDDDGSNPNANGKTVFFRNVVTARSVFLTNAGLPGLGAAFNSPQLRDGRVDGAATRLGDIRRRILFAGANWQTQQRPYILNNLVYYPRAERVAPSNHRVDQAMTNNVISSACSSFTVDWTYDLGVGEATHQNVVTGVTTNYLGVSNAGTSISSAAYEPVNETRWFGLNEIDPDSGFNRRGVFPYSFNSWPDDWAGQAQTIDPNNIESFTNNGSTYYEVNYVFGFNQDKPFYRYFGDSGGDVWRADESEGTIHTNAAYTPWPSAIRVTMVLHDPAAKLDSGREFQFVVRLPQREP